MRKLIYEPNREQGLAVYGYEPGQVVETDDDENADAMIAGGCFTEDAGSAKAYAAKLVKVETARVALEQAEAEPEKAAEEVQAEPEKVAEEAKPLEQPELDTANKRARR
jgi:hypothetical protein